MSALKIRGTLVRPFGVQILETVSSGTHELPTVSWACKTHACAVECGERAKASEFRVYSNNANTAKRYVIEYFCPCCRLTGHEPKADNKTLYVHKRCSFCDGTGRL